MKLDPIEILSEFYAPTSRAFDILVTHSRQVAQKALEAAGKVAHLNPDRTFIEEAAMLHDIGIFLTKAQKLGCNGDKPYVCHGVLGRQLLDQKGLFKHGLVCERHVGTGISEEDIQAQDLPLPHRDMLPVTIEEIIVCYADNFFSKSSNGNGTEKTIAEITGSLSAFGTHKVKTFLTWHQRFGGAISPCGQIT